MPTKRNAKRPTRPQGAVRYWRVKHPDTPAMYHQRFSLWLRTYYRSEGYTVTRGTVTFTPDPPRSTRKEIK